MPRVRIFDATSSAWESVVSCPGCGASLSCVTKSDMRPVAQSGCRCAGRHRRAFELRCPDCRRIVLMLETSSGGLAVMPGDQGASLRHMRDRDREAIDENTWAKR